MSGLLNRSLDYLANLQDFANMKPTSDFTVTSTAATKVTPLTISGCNGRCFEKQTNQVKVLRSGTYFTNVVMLLASVGNTTSIKQVSLYVNGADKMSARQAIGTLQTTTQASMIELSAGDILTMYCQFGETSGTRKLSQHAHIILMPLIIS